MRHFTLYDNGELMYYKDMTNYQQKHYNEMYKVIGNKINNTQPPPNKNDMKNYLTA